MCAWFVYRDECMCVCMNSYDCNVFKKDMYNPFINLKVEC